MAGRSDVTGAGTVCRNRPPLTYLTWWRMTLAEDRLRGSDDPLEVIGRRFGYTSEFAFAKAFKREFGVAPGRYRHTVTRSKLRRA